MPTLPRGLSRATHPLQPAASEHCEARGPEHLVPRAHPSPHRYSVTGMSSLGLVSTYEILKVWNIWCPQLLVLLAQVGVCSDASKPPRLGSNHTELLGSGKSLNSADSSDNTRCGVPGQQSTGHCTHIKSITVVIYFESKKCCGSPPCGTFPIRRLTPVR